jgi:bifunctional non-homologous end joining protein LigD
MPTFVTPSPHPGSGETLASLPLVEPVPLVTRIHAFDDPDWIFEPQYEGLRGFLYAAGGACQIRSKTTMAAGGMTELCDRIVRVLGQRETILDGEVVSLDRYGKPNLRDLIRGEGYLAFGAFDILWLDGEDLRPLPLCKRRQFLAELLPEDTGPLYKMLTLDEFGRALYSAIRKMDLAGIIAKRKQDPYDAGTTWYQILNPGYRTFERRMAQVSRLHQGRLTRRVSDQ